MFIRQRESFRLGKLLLSKILVELYRNSAHTLGYHGEPCQENAHPHYSESENLAIIHNGIIENYAVLKEKLQEKGYTFKKSSTILAEVLVQLIEYIKVSHNLDLLTSRYSLLYMKSSGICHRHLKSK